MIQQSDKPTIVVIGNGMVGHRFCERMVEFDTTKQYHIVTFCEESRAAYDRVGLTQFFAHRDAEKLMLANLQWYRENGIELHIGDRADVIDRKRREVRSQKGHVIPFDSVVLATGSYPFVPPVPGVKKQGVFVYRTIEDLQHIIAYAKRARRAAVIGGGLLGLEAAKATYDLGLETHVVEFAQRLMPRQVDECGSEILVRKIEQLGVQVHLNKSTKDIYGDGQVEGLRFSDNERLDVEMVVISAGIRPRDELARDCGLAVGERGGVLVDDGLRTSDSDIFAIGEVALHQSMIYGLVAPGYEMAETVAANLTGASRRFLGSDLSTKLKLMGIDVASFGDFADAKEEAEGQSPRSIVFEDPFASVYKRLFFTPDGRQLVGGILVGDASEYAQLAMMAKSGDPLTVEPGRLLVGDGADMGLGSVLEMADDAQVCSCNNVSKGQICEAIEQDDLSTIGDVKRCTKAGTGCGGCLPLVTDLLKAEMAAAGRSLDNHVCEHFQYSRQELFQIAKVKRLKTFGELLASHGSGDGCEVCKPTVASVLASLWNEHVVDHAELQDTNDRFLANIQRGGTYSVIPRVPGGEITPQKLITLGEVAKKYGLYTKITGGQRVDMFGAPVHQLPDIWEELVNAGFESGHAYGKAMRTVKSCVGTSWCRYAVGDSVSLAIRIEQRYRGLRAPHKLKAAVSGCVRECAEAQCKDFGLIATENGWNLYVCGNGGANPRHADLLAADLDADTCIRIVDRFLMYYAQTADKLTRTAKWLDELEGGIEHLRAVVIEDSLGINDELEQQMQWIVTTYRCEWKEVVLDPAKRKLFRQFVNTDETEAGIEVVAEREQHRPADWPTDFVPLEALENQDVRSAPAVDPPPPPAKTRWVKLGQVGDFPEEGGAAVKYGESQLAVFHFASRGQWYATQNMCPHRREFVLSRGIIGDQQGEPKVACPLHKKTFSLESGSCTSGDDYSIRTFPVRVEGADVFLQLPPEDELARSLSTKQQCQRSCDLQPA